MMKFVEELEVPEKKACHWIGYWHHLTKALTHQIALHFALKRIPSPVTAGVLDAAISSAISVQ